jgi:hypothetical protein
MFLLDLDLRLSVRIPVIFCSDAEQERRDQKSYHAFFFGRQDKAVAQLSPGPTIGKIQSG